MTDLELAQLAIRRYWAADVLSQKRALRALKEEWQPIETAPSEGEVLAITYGFSRVILEQDDLGRWWDHESPGHKPSHWMRLPELPSDLQT